MERTLKTSVAIAAVSWLASAAAFEVDTHARMTRAAWDAFIVARPTLFDDLGLVRPALKTDEKFHAYFDVLRMPDTEIPSVRYHRLFELGKILGENAQGPVVTAIEGRPDEWVAQGAVREDDYVFGPNPADDPFTGPPRYQFRVINHFLDPVNRRGLTLPLGMGAFVDTTRADDWALNREGGSDTADRNHYNHFSIDDARDAMFRALTGMNVDGTVIAATDEARNRYWATTFRSLGDVVHLIQDMGQPQHTRDDRHSGVLCPNGSPICIGGHLSVFEQYINNRALFADASTRIICSNSNEAPLEYAGQAPGLPYTGERLPTFDRYRDFFTNSGQSGLADFTNHGFFSAGTNLGDNQYAQPSNNTIAYTRVMQPVALPCNADSVRYALLYGDVNDSFRNVIWTDIPLTAESMWGAFRPRPTYTLVRANYDAMALFVVPKAVAYSAGLLQYFFRPRMEIGRPDKGVFAIADQGLDEGFKRVKLKLRNITDTGESFDGGQAWAVVRYHKNTCYEADLSGEYGAPDVTAADDCREETESIVVSRPRSLTLPANQDQPVDLDFDFSDSPLPFGSSDLYLQVVYRGPIGNERDAVAVATLDLAEPSSIALLNITDYLCVDGTFVHFGPDDKQIDNVAITRRLRDIYWADDAGNIWDPLRPWPFEAVEFRFADNGGDPANTLARIDSLPPRRFVRFAVLTDRADPAPLTVTMPNLCGPGAHCGMDVATDYLPVDNQLDYKANLFHIRKIERWRNVISDSFVSIYKSFTTSPNGPVLDCQNQIDTQPWEDFTVLEPEPIAIVGGYQSGGN